jgi:hypothetical protein
VIRKLTRPETGWKRVILPNGCYGVAKLRIPTGATVVKVEKYNIDNKRRANRAVVVAIYEKRFGVADKMHSVDTAVSGYDRTFVYAVGETVRPSLPFSRSQKTSCASGIHYFRKIEQAENY